MSVSYNKLWKLLIDKTMNKTELRLAIGASSATLAKLSRDEDVSMDTLSRICETLECNVGDILEFVGNGDKGTSQMKSPTPIRRAKGGRR